MCCRGEIAVTEKILREKEQIIAELMEEGGLLHHRSSVCVIICTCASVWV